MSVLQSNQSNVTIQQHHIVIHCVDYATVHHFTKFRSHICNNGDFTEGGRYYKGPKSPVLIGLRADTRKREKSIVLKMRFFKNLTELQNLKKPTTSHPSIQICDLMNASISNFNLTGSI